MNRLHSCRLLISFILLIAFTVLTSCEAMAQTTQPGAPAAALPLPTSSPAWAKAYALPKWTTTEGSGYFSIVAGLDNRVYVGTAAYGKNAYLVEFNPDTEAMAVVIDAQKEIGADATGFAAQAKFHTRNNVGKSGKIYVATKQGYPQKGEARTDYLGGYPMVYDPKTGTTKVYPIVPVPHHGIISITPDEDRGVAYISTCDDARPIESTHFMVLDLKTGEYRDLMDAEHMYAFIVVDNRGRAYHPILGGEIARFDPRLDKVKRLKQTVDGAPPTPASGLANNPAQPVNWDVSPDGTSLYAVAMTSNELVRYDLTASGDTLKGKTLGPLIPGAERTDCRALCVGPTGRVWAIVTHVTNPRTVHLVGYTPGDDAPTDYGPIAIRNPKYTPTVDDAGEALKWHHGFATRDGVMSPLYPMGVAEDHNGVVYGMSIYPFTLFQFETAK